MGGYWVRHRLLLTIVTCVAVALIASFLFVYPSILQQAQAYNAQSVYKNTDIDFIAPEPSFEQVSDLPGTNGIKELFPFFLTKTSVGVNGKSRTTTVLLSDEFQNVGFTMYNDARLIEKSSIEYDNPILVDWQFCKDTSAGIGDSVSFAIGGKNTEFKIYAIFETNSIYDGGAVMVPISPEQKSAIAQQSNNNGYSGMYVASSDYNACRTYLTTEYRPLGRLKARDQFSTDEQYQVHYDAIMSSGYANEITDFQIRENSFTAENSGILCYVGALLAAVIMIGFNIAMARRGCEKVYFTKNCVPKGQDVKPYYRTAFVVELLALIFLFVAFLSIRISFSDAYIPRTSIGISVLAVPLACVVSEIISICLNNATVSDIVRRVDLERQEAKEQAEENEEETLLSDK